MVQARAAGSLCVICLLLMIGLASPADSSAMNAVAGADHAAANAVVAPRSLDHISTIAELMRAAPEPSDGLPLPRPAPRRDQARFSTLQARGS